MSGAKRPARGAADFAQRKRKSVLKKRLEVPKANGQEGQLSLFGDNLPKAEIVLTFPMRNGREFPVTNQLIEQLEPLYPAVDITQTLREMQAWLLLNPERRKTRRGMGQFIANWLTSEQAKYAKP